jgi:hypothetical protein
MVGHCGTSGDPATAQYSGRECYNFLQEDLGVGIDIKEGGLDDPRVIELLRIHVARARAETAVGSAHALDVSQSFNKFGACSVARSWLTLDKTPTRIIASPEHG